MDEPVLQEAAQELLARCRRAGLRLAFVEASTAGRIVSCLTGQSGASQVVEGGVVPYSNELKVRWLGVPPALLETHGAVSAEAACALAEGLLSRSSADLVLAETGVAGPGGGSPTKPVGLVFFAIAARGQPTAVERQLFSGDRQQVQRAATAHALNVLHRHLPCPLR